MLVRTVNLGLKATRQMLETHLRIIGTALQTGTLVELDQQTVSVVAW